MIIIVITRNFYSSFATLIELQCVILLSEFALVRLVVW